MTFPSIKIQFIGTTCTCCSGSEKNEFRVAYRADKDSFVAISPEEATKNKRACDATIQAIDNIIREKYALHLSDIPVHLSQEDLPSIGEVRTIESIAKKMFEDSRNDLS